MFLVAVPIAAVAFVLTWLLPEIRLRHTVGDAERAPANAPASVPADGHGPHEQGS